ncbi:Gfo/Idh/MocA family protein [Limnovirga soli]|uniref:Gfo/Idh/MocA family oxidoreductase n=1 Tax=Limnovirga soli TaxID=2656915 RepID=A0A8J8FIA6_9BACT|nr:Gfo/Idh/MocA family oxidoreductase [Limnovirga soli]NNV55584.1 gfo/Idh/MocA family oxidoreductase [Limnovirga soli]
MKKYLYCLLLTILCNAALFMANAQSTAPVRLAIAGLTHGHAVWIFERKDKTDISLVGIYEPNTALAQSYATKYHLPASLFFTDLATMLEAVKPEAVAAFGSIYQHTAVVEACAPRGIHVMVEKPLSTNYADALRMQQLAQQNHIFLLTNFETSWYPSTVKTYQLVNDSNYMGNITKVIIHDGHQGPKEIGVSNEFFNWLTDPVQNGGGALVDFGCYGANLITYLMKGEAPISVTAITQQYKPLIYPKVDDEATIVLTYPAAQCIIQASWNWPFGRKDMEVYGQKGYAITVNNNTMRIRNKESVPEQTIQVSAADVPVYTDPFAYLADVIRKKIEVPENGVYALKTNMMVVKILDAARESAKTGKTVMFK